MFFFVILRWIFTTVFFQAGLAYGAFIALNQIHRHLMSVEPHTLNDRDRKTEDVIEKHVLINTLKLCLMLTFLASLSYLGADYFPFFLEIRVLFTWLLLSVPPLSHGKIFDSAFEPIISRAESTLVTVDTHKRIGRNVAFKIVRGFVEMGVIIINVLKYSSALEEDAAHDILSGLVLARRALQGAEGLTGGSTRSSYPSGATTFSCQ